MHPEASSSTCSTIISAHTRSRKSLLGKIVDSDNHVLSFKNPNPFADRSEPVKVGWKQASTFPGFCSLHDQVFSRIDSGGFTASIEECFLLSYRGICHEIFQKMAAYEDYMSMRSTLDKGKNFEKQQEIQGNLNAGLMGTQKGLRELGKQKTDFDHSLLSKDYSAWKHAIFFFEGSLSVASVGTFSPNRSLNGTEIQVMHDINTPQQPVVLSVVATDVGCAVILFWKIGHDVVSGFTQEVIDTQPKDVSGLLIQLMFAYLSNTYFSEKWWKWISSAAKQQIASLAQISNAYYTDFGYETFKFADWKLLRIEH